MKKISEGLKLNKTLRYLNICLFNLAYNTIKEDGSEYLAKAFKFNNTLESLYISTIN